MAVSGRNHEESEECDPPFISGIKKHISKTLHCFRHKVVLHQTNFLSPDVLVANAHPFPSKLGLPSEETLVIVIILMFIFPFAPLNSFQKVIHKIHEGLKLFKCDVCGKAFSRRSYLTVHERIHTGKRPYQCHVCGCAFYRGDHLVRHRRKQHGEEPVTTVYVTTASDGSQTVYTHANPGDLQPQQLNIQVQMDGQELKCNNIIINSIGESIESDQKNATYTDCTMCNTSCGGTQCCIEATQQQEQQQVQQVQQIQQSPQQQQQQQQQQPQQPQPQPQQHIITDCSGITKMVIGEQIETPIQFQNCATIEEPKPFAAVQRAVLCSSGTTVADGTTTAVTTNSKASGRTGAPVSLKCEFCNRTFSRRDNLERHKSSHSDIKQQQQQQQQQTIDTKDINTNEANILTVTQQMAPITGEGGTVVVPVSNVQSLTNSKTQQIYHTTIAKLGSTTTAMPVFPSTIEISPATTQIFPTIQMYASTCLNVPQTVRNNTRDTAW
ncbi:zinc finger protein 594 [Octopus bimaculoides]|nr:zinc finger protein 594 [Octopus bimaculoides]|eukprot:XP_014771514.1 PREDICTED: zinc finger protein 594-like [Octopus bimaculoides]